MVEGDNNNNTTDNERQAQIEAVWQRIQQRSGVKPAVIKEALEADNNQVNISETNKSTVMPSKKSKKPLITACIIIVLLIIGGVITAGFFTDWFGLIKSDEPDGVTISELIDTSGQMPNVKFEDIPDPTKAVILSSNIQEKIDGYQDYTTDKAIAEYKQVYNVAEGSLKLYVALEYAHYLYDNTDNLNQAVEIMDSVKNEVNENNELDYYNSLLNLYTKADVQQKIDEYTKLLEEISPVLSEEERQEL